MKKLIFISILFLTTFTSCIKQTNLEIGIYNDLESAISKSSQLNLPILIYFYNYGCTGNINKFERLITNSISFRKLIKEKFIFLKIYTDEKRYVDVTKINQENLLKASKKVANKLDLCMSGRLYSQFQVDEFHSNSAMLAVISSEFEKINISNKLDMSKSELLNFLAQSKLDFEMR